MLVGLHLRPTLFFDAFGCSMMMLTGDLLFPNETGRTDWEVRERAVL